MTLIKAKKREKQGKQNESLRDEGILPAILYGEGIKNVSIEVTEKEFEQAYKEAGESSLISLELDKDKYDVLIHQIAKDPLSDRFIHVDFYKPSTKKRVEAEIPLVFKGESLAVKDLGGILARELNGLIVKGLAHNLPREIIVDISGLNNFEDRIYVKDLELPEGIESQRAENEIVALVVPQKEEKEEEPVVEEGEEGEAPTEGEADGDKATPENIDTKEENKE
jgi:large subunit ribosomal protein L25